MTRTRLSRIQKIGSRRVDGELMLRQAHNARRAAMREMYPLSIVDAKRLALTRSI